MSGMVSDRMARIANPQRERRHGAYTANVSNLCYKAWKTLAES